MAERKVFRVLSNRAQLDALISYFTDAQSLLTDHAAWIAQHHVDRNGFVDMVIGAIDSVLSASATSTKEQAESVAATTIQSEVMGEAQVVATGIRTRGAYIGSELDHKTERLDAAKVRAASGVGSRLNIKRQTGLRRLLMIQHEGLPKIATIWSEWNPTTSGQPSDLERVNQALANIEAAMKTQAKEQVEAHLALDYLEERVLYGLDSMNRVIRLVNSVYGDIPQTLQAGLESLETQHSSVFWTQSQPAEPEVPTPPLDPDRPMD